MVRLGEIIMILELHRQGLSVTAIARRTGLDPKTIRKYIERGLEAPAYGPRSAAGGRALAPYVDYLRERVAAFPELSAAASPARSASAALRRLHRREALSARDPSRDARRRSRCASRHRPGIRRRSTSPASSWLSTDEPGITRIVWLFSLVLGHSRHHRSRASCCIRTCRRCCAATWRPSRRSAACRWRSSTTA